MVSSEQLIHRFWHGPDPMPERYQEFGQEWERLNPDWLLVDWTEGDVPKWRLRNQDIYDALGVPAPGHKIHPVALATQRADVVGYELVYKFGGVYVNCDILPVKPIDRLDELIEGGYAFAGREDDHFIVNAVLGGPPQHPFWAACIDRLRIKYWMNPYGPMNEVTGPFLITEVANAWEKPGLVILPKETFNPIHFSEIEHGTEPVFNVEDLPEETIGVHYWGHKMSDRTNFVNEAI